MTTLNTTAATQATVTTQAAAVAESQPKSVIDLEGDDFDLPVCGLNPNDPAFAGCEACQ